MTQRSIDPLLPAAGSLPRRFARKGALRLAAFVAGGIVLSLLAGGCGREKSPVIARVNQKPITQQQLWEALEKNENGRSTWRMPQVCPSCGGPIEKQGAHHHRKESYGQEIAAKGPIDRHCK